MSEKYVEHLFVINLRSGKERQRAHLIQEIEKRFPGSTLFIVKEREDFSRAIELSQSKKYRYIVVSGGDGTIHSFLPVIIEQAKILGILPSGSGNGLARTLNIPLHPLRALALIEKNTVQKIDVGKITIEKGSEKCYHYFSCAVGFGVDAPIAYRFEHQKIRGLLGYLLAAFKQIFFHKSIKARIEVDSEMCPEQNFLVLSVMNIPQYGNDFYLSPSARVNDGFLNVVLLKKVSFFQYPYVLFNVLRKKEKKPMQFCKFKEMGVHILSSDFMYYHIDGEPQVISSVFPSFKINILPSALQVLS